MHENDQERIARLLRQSLPPVGAQPDSNPPRDLWPAMLKRLDAPLAAMPWFDWALIAIVVAWLAFFPGAIPVLLYHL